MTEQSLPAMDSDVPIDRFEEDASAYLIDASHSEANDPLPYEPDDTMDDNDPRLNIYHIPETNAEAEMILERIGVLRREMIKRNEYVDAFVEKKKAEYERFLEKAELFRDSSTRKLRRKLSWLYSCLEEMLRSQPEDVRSIKFINGVVKRRKMGYTGKTTDKKAAVQFLKERGLNDLIRVKEEPADSKIKEAVINGAIDKEEVETWFELREPYDKYEVVTPTAQ